MLNILYGYSSNMVPSMHGWNNPDEGGGDMKTYGEYGDAEKFG
jgi:hypothetical protein